MSCKNTLSEWWRDVSTACTAAWFAHVRIGLALGAGRQVCLTLNEHIAKRTEVPLYYNYVDQLCFWSDDCVTELKTSICKRFTLSVPLCIPLYLCPTRINSLLKDGPANWIPLFSVSCSQSQLCVCYCCLWTSCVSMMFALFQCILKGEWNASSFLCFRPFICLYVRSIVPLMEGHRQQASTHMLYVTYDILKSAMHVFQQP